MARQLVIPRGKIFPRCPYCGLHKDTTEHRDDLPAGRQVACDECYDELYATEDSNADELDSLGTWEDET